MTRFSRVASGACVLLAAVSIHAAPVSVTGRLTADNHYGLYTGQANGSGLAFHGRNELGSGSAQPGCAYNWSCPETWTFNAGAGDYLYVVAWDDGGPQMWIGDFQWGSSILRSNKADWEYYVSALTFTPNVTGGVVLPSNTAISAEIAAATWAAPAAEASQPQSPWGTIPGLDAADKFLWSDTFAIAPPDTNTDGRFVIFRSANPVPEPGSLALVGLALAGIAAAHRRRG